MKKRRSEQLSFGARQLTLSEQLKQTRKPEYPAPTRGEDNPAPQYNLVVAVSELNEAIQTVLRLPKPRRQGLLHFAFQDGRIRLSHAAAGVAIPAAGSWPTDIVVPVQALWMFVAVPLQGSEITIAYTPGQLTIGTTRFYDARPAARARR